MRVHVVIDALGHGGAEMLLGDLAAGAPAAGLELSVSYLFSRDGDPAARRLRERGIEPVRIPVSGLLSPAGHRAVRRALAAVDPDVVHTHLEYADFFGGLGARALGLPAISSIHVMRWDRSLRERSKLALQALVRRRAMDSVICVSDAARRAYRQAGWARGQRVLAVPNGIENRPRPGAGAKIRAELGLDPSALVAGMVTVLRPGKGHEAAVAAVARAAIRFPELCLLVAGTGPSQARIAELAAGSGGRVRLLGHRSDVMELLDGCDLLLHPTEVDAFPTAVLEAMAAAVPVLATRVGGIPEILGPGDTGLLVDAPASAPQLAAALEHLLGRPELRAALGQAGRARFTERFTAEQWAGRLADVYGAAIARARRTQGEHLSAKRKAPSG